MLIGTKMRTLVSNNQMWNRKSLTFTSAFKAWSWKTIQTTPLFASDYVAKQCSLSLKFNNVEWNLEILMDKVKVWTNKNWCPVFPIELQHFLSNKIFPKRSMFQVIPKCFETKNDLCCNQTTTLLKETNQFSEKE